MWHDWLFIVWWWRHVNQVIFPRHCACVVRIVLRIAPICGLMIGTVWFLRTSRLKGDNLRKSKYVILLFFLVKWYFICCKPRKARRSRSNPARLVHGTRSETLNETFAWVSGVSSREFLLCSCSAVMVLLACVHWLALHSFGTVFGVSWLIISWWYQQFLHFHVCALQVRAPRQYSLYPRTFAEWNCLPARVRDAPTIGTFKDNVKLVNMGTIIEKAHFKN